MQTPLLPPQVPATNGRGQWLGRTAMRVWGWQFAGTFPNLSKFVLIVAPHTSNWDFFVAVSAKLALGIDVKWIGKHSIFRWPVRGILIALGGMPIDRSTPHGVVRTVVDTFRTRERMVFGLAPEGTRRKVEHWRSGYWRVAREAGVPIVPVGLDYKLKTVFIGPPLMPGDSLEADEKKLRAYFSGVSAKRPENFSS